MPRHVCEPTELKHGMALTKPLVCELAEPKHDMALTKPLALTKPHPFKQTSRMPRRVWNKRMGARESMN